MQKYEARDVLMLFILVNLQGYAVLLQFLLQRFVLAATVTDCIEKPAFILNYYVNCTSTSH